MKNMLKTIAIICIFWMILYHVRGPTSFTNLKTVNGVVHPTLQEGYQVLELLDDEHHWITTLEESALFQSRLQEFFVVTIEFRHIIDLPGLGKNHKDNMSWDI